jgi:hypothetical protein
MKSLVIFVVALCVGSMCNKEKASKHTDSSIPLCIQNKIDEIKKQQKWNPPAEVNEYLFNGKKVYLFSADCCDQFYTLVDSACNYVCAPSGGIAGKGDGKCADFNEKAQLLRLVWKDDR